MSVYLSVCQPVCWPVCPSLFLSVNLFVCPSICLLTYLTVRLSASWSVYRSVGLAAYMSVYMNESVFEFVSLCLSIGLFAYLSVSQWSALYHAHFHHPSLTGVCHWSAARRQDWQSQRLPFTSTEAAAETRALDSREIVLARCRQRSNSRPWISYFLQRLRIHRSVWIPKNRRVILRKCSINGCRGAR